MAYEKHEFFSPKPETAIYWKEVHEKVPAGELKAEFNPSELEKAYDIYEALKELCAEEQFAGFTLRCFDIIKAVKMSACLGLSLMNRDGIIASCEGDVPAMITAYSILKCLGVHAFQANPNWIDPVKNELTLAHCTLPLDMADTYQFDTHFESGIGVGIHAATGRAIERRYPFEARSSFGSKRSGS